MYVGERPGTGAPGLLRVFDGESGELVSQFGAGQVAGEGGPYGVAAGEAAGYLYSDSYGNETNAEFPERFYAQRFEIPAPGPLIEGARAEAPLPTEATLEATLSPEGAPTTYRFQYLTRAEYEAHGFAGCGSPANPACVQGPEETLEEGGSPYEGLEARALSSQLEGLIPGTAYRFRLVAENADGETEAEAAFTTPAAVGIEAQWVSALDARGATLNAKLDPLGAAGSWWLEYGTSPCSQGGCARAAEGSLPASVGAIAVGAALVGLEPSRTYYYRFAASDQRGPAICEAPGAPCEVRGPDRSFTTQPAGLGSTLPDGRAWEMVSPPDKHGGRIRAFGEGAMQAAVNGEALTFLSLGSLEAPPQTPKATA